MVTYVLTSAHDQGDDVLLVKGLEVHDPPLTQIGEDGEEEDCPPNEVTATGWMSAILSHFGEDSVGDNGHRIDGAEPREMTEEETREYCLRLLAQQNAKPKPVRSIL